MDRNQAFVFEHVEFEISFRHPGGNVKQAVGHMRLELEEMCSLERDVGVTSVTKAMRL